MGKNRFILYILEDSLLWVERAIKTYKYTKSVFKNLANQLKIFKLSRSSLFSICEITKKYYRVLQIYWKTKIKIDYLEDLEPHLKTCGHNKDSNIFNSYLKAPKRPSSRLLRLNSPWLRRPLKLNRRSRYLW